MQRNGGTPPGRAPMRSDKRQCEVFERIGLERVRRGLPRVFSEPSGTRVAECEQLAHGLLDPRRVAIAEVRRG